MRHFIEYTCEGCPSRCNKEETNFMLEQHAKGERFVSVKDKNYVVFIASGKISINSDTIDNFLCDCDNFVLFLENEEYKIEVLEDCELLLLMFVRPYQVCDQISMEDFKYIVEGYQYSFHAMNANDSMKLLIQTTAKFLRDGIGCEHLHRSKQLELFIINRFYYLPKDLFEFYYPIIDKKMYVQSLVRRHFNKAKNVAELATLCGYSLSSFNKVFTQIFKESPYQWMRQQNVKRVRALLLNKEIPIKVIAAECGFTCQSHLNKFCKQFLGGTPTQIRTGHNQ